MPHSADDNNTVWTLIRPSRMFGLIGIQNVPHSYGATKRMYVAVCWIYSYWNMQKGLECQ